MVPFTWLLRSHRHVIHVFPNGFDSGYKIVHDPTAPDIRRSVTSITLHFPADGTLRVNDDAWDFVHVLDTPDYRFEDGTHLHFAIPGDYLPPGPFARSFRSHLIVGGDKRTEWIDGEVGLKLPE